MDAKTKEAIDLLRTLIATPSPSRDESRTADLIFAYLAEHGAAPEKTAQQRLRPLRRLRPNAPDAAPELPPRHGTPAASYTRDPFARPSKATASTAWGATTPGLRR